MKLLLDTNVVSELRKIRSGKADPNLARWADTVATNDLFISVITVQEIETGVLLMERRDRIQGQILRTWLERHVLPAFHGRVLTVDLRVARKCATLHVPDPKPFRDALIAATALVHGLVVVTRDIDDFRQTGVSLVNPWSAT